MSLNVVASTSISSKPGRPDDARAASSPPPIRCATRVSS